MQQIFFQLKKRCLDPLNNKPLGSQEIQFAFTNMLSKIPRLKNVNKVAVALSGGPDSLALLHSSVQYFGPSNVLAISIDHDLPDCKENETDIEHLISHLNVEHVHKKIHWPHGIPPTQNKTQLKARELRYGLMGQVCSDRKINLLLVGHHKDDDFATMFYRMGRGSGVDGLAGMKPINTLPLIDPITGRIEGDLIVGVFIGRPLLPFPKSRLLATCQANFQSALFDETNTSDLFLRNSVQSSLLKANLDLNKLDHFLETIKLLKKHMQEQLNSTMRQSVILDRNNGNSILVLNSPSLLEKENKPLVLRTINILIQYTAAANKPVRSPRLNELYNNMQLAYYSFQQEQIAKRKRIPKHFQNLDPLPTDLTRRVKTVSSAMGGGIIYPLGRTDTLRRITMHNQKNPSRQIKFGPAFLIQSEKPPKNQHINNTLHCSPSQWYVFDNRIFIKSSMPLDSNNIDWTVECLGVEQIKTFETLTRHNRQARLPLQQLLATTPMTHTYHLPIIFGERRHDKAIVYSAIPTINAIWDNGDEMFSNLTWKLVHAGESVLASRFICLH